MKIPKLELKNFKRFDDLTIDMTSLAEPPKLVLLIGKNGSGKSSVFDGFEVLNTVNKGSGVSIANDDDRPRLYYGNQIKERQNLNRNNLAKTAWFKKKIEEVLQK